MQGKAGTVFITHWDTAHAGGAPGEISRFMVKFAFLRVVHPSAYAMPVSSSGAVELLQVAAAASHPAASQHIFRWLRGLPKLSETEAVRTTFCRNDLLPLNCSYACPELVLVINRCWCGY